MARSVVFHPELYRTCIAQRDPDMHHTIADEMREARFKACIAFISSKPVGAGTLQKNACLRTMRSGSASNAVDCLRFSSQR